MAAQAQQIHANSEDLAVSLNKSHSRLATYLYTFYENKIHSFDCIGRNTILICIYWQ